MIQLDLEHLPLERLKRIYESMSFKFRAALINGYSWHDVNDQKELLTALCKAIHRKDPTYLLSEQDITLQNEQPADVTE
jgi:hypothetical protein